MYTVHIIILHCIRGSQPFFHNITIILIHKNGDTLDIQLTDFLKPKQKILYEVVRRKKKSKVFYR